MRLPKHKAARLFDEARARLAAGDAASAESLCAQLLEESSLPREPLLALRAEALIAAGRVEEGLAGYREALQSSPADPQLHAGLGNALARQGDFDAALPHFAKASAAFKRDGAFLVNHGHALVQSGRNREGREVLARAVAGGGGPQARLFLALALARSGELDEAEAACLKVEAAAPALRPAAQDIRAECRLFRGDGPGALELWKPLRESGQLQPEHLCHMACSAQLAGEPELARALVEERLASQPTPEDLLFAAEIAHLRSEPEAALGFLDRAGLLEDVASKYPGFAVERQLARARSLQQLGRSDEARAALDTAAALPEAMSSRFRPRLEEERARVTPAAPGGEAPAVEPAPSAKSVENENEELRRRFVARETELENLRRELEELKAAQRQAEERARAAEAAVKQSARVVTDELQVRDAEITAKAEENVARALGEAASRCPPAIAKALLVAERTFQQALYTELPAAAVAVLYAGALERTLFILFVERFQRWLHEQGRLSAFLAGAVRERRGTRVDYFDHFVEAFDEERPGRAPSMGEVGRVIERRREPYLKPFLDFLDERYGFPEPFGDELARFILWSKQQLRDPVAHGRAIELGYEELRKFREQLLFAFGDTGRGLLASLVAGG